MRVDIGAPVKLNPRDTVMVASDGLTDNVHFDEIIDCIRKGPLTDAVDRAVDLAAHRMHAEQNGLPSKPDDLSLILFRKLAPGRS